MEHVCNVCNRNFSSEESLKQHNIAKHSSKQKKARITPRKYLIFTILALIILFSSLAISSYMKQPGQFDEFTQCLTEKDVVVYGNDFCSYTGQQLNYFGKSEKHLNYIKCINNQQLCDEKQIKITPTWEIDGKMYEGIQTFERLSALTGCEI